jgi:uncharacterized protein DUF6011
MVAYATTELEMVQDARAYLLANGGTAAELEINQRMIDKYSAEAASPIPAFGMPVQRTGGPKAPRKPDMARQGQIDYASDLLRRLWGHDPAVLTELVARLGTVQEPKLTRDRISRQIDNLISILASQPRPINPELRTHLQDLWTRKMGKADGTRDATRDAAFARKMETMTYDEGRKLADQLRVMADGPAVAPPAPAEGELVAEVTEGMYRNPETDEVWKVQVAHHGSGRLYAKKMVELDEPRIVRGKEVRYGFVYVPSALQRVRPEWRMTLEDAAAWGKLYGCCIRCGAILTDEESRDAGIGPVCSGKM